jgi:hypothetical protein
LRCGARSRLPCWTFRAFAEGLKEENIEFFEVNVAIFRKSVQIARVVDQVGLDQEFDTFRYRQGVEVVQQIWPNRDWKCWCSSTPIGRVAGCGRMILGASRW